MKFKMRRKRKKFDSLEQVIIAIVVLSIFLILSRFIPEENNTKVKQ